MDLPPLQPSLNITDLQPRASVHREMPSTCRAPLVAPCFSKGSLPTPCPARPAPLPLSLLRMRFSGFTKRSVGMQNDVQRGSERFNGDGNRKVGMCGEADSARQGLAGRV